MADPRNAVDNGSPMKTGPIVYLALGDSTGAGVGATEGGYVLRLFKRIQPLRPSSTLVNLCVSGATTSDLLRGQLEKGIAASPDLVTVGIGINDVGHGIGIDEFATNYEQILSSVRSRTSARIVVTNLPDISSAPRIPNSIKQQYRQQIIAFNQRLGEIAARHGAAVFDVFAVTSKELPQHPEYFSADGFHPSDEGYALWADQMWPTVQDVLKE
jgi:acyl-CoA thioesterase I